METTKRMRLEEGNYYQKNCKQRCYILNRLCLTDVIHSRKKYGHQLFSYN